MGAWGATGKNDDDDDDDEDKDKSEIENSRKLIRHLRSFFFFHYKMIKFKDLVFLLL